MNPWSTQMLSKDASFASPDEIDGGERLLAPKEVVKRTSLSRTTLWRLSRSGAFPKPISLSPGRRGWPESAIVQWIQDRMGVAR
jgi:prophage regulatory protein